VHEALVLLGIQCWKFGKKPLKCIFCYNVYVEYKVWINANAAFMVKTLLKLGIWNLGKCTTNLNLKKGT
jgi:hypothetical protein